MTESSPQPGDHDKHRTSETQPSPGCATDRDTSVTEAGTPDDAPPSSSHSVTMAEHEPGAAVRLSTKNSDNSDEDEDDDEGDEDEEEDDEDEEDEEEDEEPRLKYARLTQNIGPVYRNGDATSAFLVAGDKMVWLPQSPFLPDTRRHNR